MLICIVADACHGWQFVGENVFYFEVSLDGNFWKCSQEQLVWLGKVVVAAYPDQENKFRLEHIRQALASWEQDLTDIVQKKDM